LGFNKDYRNFIYQESTWETDWHTGIYLEVLSQNSQIGLYDNTDEGNKESDDSDEEEADDSGTEEAKDDFHWSEICRNWIDLAECENQFDNDEDNHLLKMARNFYAARRNVHPADDKTAKWNLEYFFNENIKAPTFLRID
jgi:hypothetical protein